MAYTVSVKERRDSWYKNAVESPINSLHRAATNKSDQSGGRRGWGFTGLESGTRQGSAARDVKAELKKIDLLGLSMKAPKPKSSRTEEACFGELLFDRLPEPGESRLHQWPPPAKFCAFSDDSDIDKIFQLLCECWALKRPSVLLSVTGSALDLDLEPRLEHEFSDKLSAAAQHTGGWVITGGTDTGVMAIVGRALRERNLQADELAPVIGVAPWGKVMHRDDEDNGLRNRKRLDLLFKEIHKRSSASSQDESTLDKISEELSEPQPRRSRMWREQSPEEALEEALQAATVAYKKLKKNSNDEVALDPGHTHFLLVDNVRERPLRRDDQPWAGAGAICDPAKPPPRASSVSSSASSP